MLEVETTSAYIQLHNGKLFDLLNPDPELILIEDISWALSNLCRFTGHCKRFYSVAEHSYHVSNIVPAEFAREGLLHDASEAYLTDISRPLKRWLPDYKVIETKIEQAIAERFDLIYPWPKEVKAADEAMLGEEARQLMRVTSESRSWWEPFVSLPRPVYFDLGFVEVYEFNRRAKGLGLY